MYCMKNQNTYFSLSIRYSIAKIYFYILKTQGTLVVINLIDSLDYNWLNIYKQKNRI